MYSIANSTLALFYKQYRQIVEITMNRTDGTEYLTEADIIQGGMTVDRYCISGDKIEIGSAIAAELTLKLDNREGKFDDTNFEGAELFVRIGIKKWDAGRWENAKVEYVPIGYFTVDESPKKALSITLSALDRMVQFDKDFDADGITFPTTVGNLLTYCCTKCGVPLKTIPETLPNYSYQVKECPQRENLTYRQIIQWIGEITATCGYIDWDGKLRMEWYSNTDTVIDKSLRYTSDMNEKDVTITGVQVEDDEENIYLAGTDEYALNIEGNALIQYDHNVIAHAVYEQVNGFTYRPYTCTTKSLPHLYPMDKISYVDKNGVSHNSIVTHWVYKLNGRTHLTAKGVTATKENYAKANPLTAREAAVLAKMKKANEIELNSRQQAVLALNETIVNSLGLFMSTVEEGNGSIVYYYHNAATLEDSSVIYTFREGGFAWTDDWNDGDPVWQYGMTKDGNAVLNVLSTYKIQTEYLDAGCVTAEKLSVEYKQSVIDEITGAETRVTQSFQAADGILSSKISEKAAQADLDDLTGRVSTAETSIEQNAKEIKLKATQTSVDALGNTVSAQGTQITQNAQAITLKAAQADLDDLTGRVSTAESTISVQGNRIALVVNSSNSIKAASIVTAINGSASTVKISAKHIDIDGILTISNIATTDDIPTHTSDLTNDSGFQTKSGVTTIIGDTITTGYIEGLGCEFTSGKIGGWIVANGWLKSDGSENGVYCGLYSGAYKTDAYYTCNKPSLVNPGTYSNGRFYAGASSSEKVSDSKFTVLDDGSLYAEAAKISGVLTAAAGSSIGDFSVTTDGNLSLNTTANQSKYMDVSKTYNSVTYNTRVSTGTIQLSRASSTRTNYITIDNAGNSFPQLHFGYGGVYDGISFKQYNATYMQVAGSSSNFIIYDCGFGVYNGGYHLGVTCQIKIQTTTGDHVYMRIDKGVITGLSQSLYNTTTYPDKSSGSI